MLKLNIDFPLKKIRKKQRKNVAKPFTKTNLLQLNLGETPRIHIVCHTIPFPLFIISSIKKHENNIFAFYGAQFTFMK